MPNDPAAQLLLRVGGLWFAASPHAVTSVEAWQPLIMLPWPTRFLGLLPCRGALFPVLDERSLGCTGIERKRIALYALQDSVVGIPASEVRLSTQDLAAEPAELAQSLEAALALALS